MLIFASCGVAPANATCSVAASFAFPFSLVGMTSISGDIDVSSALQSEGGHCCPGSRAPNLGGGGMFPHTALVFDSHPTATMQISCRWLFCCRRAFILPAVFLLPPCVCPASGLSAAAVCVVPLDLPLPLPCVCLLSVALFATVRLSSQQLIPCHWVFVSQARVMTF